jgi:hypothetical protein
MKNKHYAYESPFEMVDTEGVKYTLEVEQDDCGESPRDWDNLCTMICWHRHYNLGDKHDFDGIEDFFQSLCKQVLGKGYDETDDLYWQDMFKMLDESNLILIKPINMYDHSGITVSTSNGYPYNDRWDAGCVGFIYVTKKKIFDECGDITEENWKERADKYLEGEMETYDQYCRGEVYGFRLIKTVVKQETCPHCGEVIREYEEETEEDSCWGFYGDCLEDNGMLSNLGDLKFVEEE